MCSSSPASTSAASAIDEILGTLGFDLTPHGAQIACTPPSWRRDVEGKADLVEEVARIAGFDALPSDAAARARRAAPAAC